MKKLSIIFLAFCFLGLLQTSFGQTDLSLPITNKSAFPKEGDFAFLSVEFVRDDKTKEMRFMENVSFESKNFEFWGADKAIYNETTRKMTVYGCQGFTIDGKVVIKNGGKLGNILEYTVGKDTVFLF